MSLRLTVGGLTRRARGARTGTRIAVAVAVGAVVAIGTFALLLVASSGGGNGPAASADWSDPGRRVFAAQGCGSCHRLAAAGSTGRMGPDLDSVLAAHDRHSLRASIVDRATEGGFSAMPGDYGARMTAAELDALIAYLLTGR